MDRMEDMACIACIETLPFIQSFIAVDSDKVA